ncbi:hypothetical protein C1645_836459 [Glomus cerebriforme]|uniref:Jacalin-type lectin domain-containing protein n=1 Tax=Glomus cerebriforme TaxID=658196 RepID=A0A397SCL1_9GLOM|nr:hypothetical protein C1645_836459 [Glomus cerebriforme]
MTITIKSTTYGGDGGNSHNDFNDIITSFGGSSNIKSININEITINSGGVVDGLQFNYNVVTMDGVSNNYQGNKYGGNGGSAKYFPLAVGEQLLKISGTSGPYTSPSYSGTTILYLEFQSSDKTLSYGNHYPDEQAFSFPAGVIYGSGSPYMTGIGAYMVAEEIQPSLTTTVNSSASTAQPTITNSPASDNPTPVNSNSPLVVALSYTTAILGLYFLITVGIFLWRKFRVSPSRGSRSLGAETVNL